MQDSYDKVFNNKNRIMFVFAHPDDAEIYCGGIISRLVRDGKKVKLVKMTTGNKGSRQEVISESDLSTLRESEDENALKVYGLTVDDNVNLNLGDGNVENSTEVIGKLVEQVRKFKPEIIFTHNPEKKLIRDLEGAYYVNHRDHINTGISVVDAVYPYSRDILFFPEQIKSGLESHTVTELLFVDSWGHEDSIGLDITDDADQKIAAIASHKSQYSQKKAQDSTDFFAPIVDGKRFEQFRYVVID